MAGDEKLQKLNRNNSLTLLYKFVAGLYFTYSHSNLTASSNLKM